MLHNKIGALIGFNGKFVATGAGNEIPNEQKNNRLAPKLTSVFKRITIFHREI